VTKAFIGVIQISLSVYLLIKKQSILRTVYEDILWMSLMINYACIFLYLYLSLPFTLHCLELTSHSFTCSTNTPHLCNYYPPETLYQHHPHLFYLHFYQHHHLSSITGLFSTAPYLTPIFSTNLSTIDFLRHSTPPDCIPQTLARQIFLF